MSEKNIKGADTVVISESNLNSGIVHKERKVIFDSNYWHKVIVENANTFHREFVLETIMSALHPRDFIPICYTLVNNKVTFLLKNCGASIIEMCRLNLTIPHSDVAKGIPSFKFTVVLQYAHARDLKIDIQANIQQVLKKRYNVATKTLNLDQFYREPDLLEFCPLSQSKLMYYVLHLSRDLKVDCLKLSNNDLELLKPLEALANTLMWKGLSNIDLRKNKLKQEEQLTVLKQYPITELFLDENPLCENLLEHEYVKTVKEYCPKITKLDGMRIPTFGMLSFRRNFICDPSGQEIIDKFLEHYYTIYDSQNRTHLEDTYHADAMFSLTCNHLHGQGSSVNSKLNEYIAVSRNIKRLANFSKSGDYLYTGSKQIIQILAALPKCEHDPYTFTVDLTQYTLNRIVFTITGVFKECSESLLGADYFYGFTRTFVLMLRNREEYNIVNEQFHISNATTSQESRAFKTVKVPRIVHVQIPAAKDYHEKLLMVNGFSQITNLNANWSRKCLEECNYDLKRAMNLFLELFKVERLPMMAFRNNINPLNNSTSKPQLCGGCLKKIENTHTSPSQTVKHEHNLKTETSSPSIRAPSESSNRRSNSNSRDKSEPSKISDKVLQEAINISLDTPETEARLRLMRGAERVIKQYTFCPKYYKALGREFYRFDMVREAREFFEDGIKLMSKSLGEEVFSIYTLFEIQFGDPELAKDMIIKTVRTYDVQKTVKFIGVHVANINVPLAREMFEESVKLNLPRKTIEALFDGFKEFEMKYGNVESFKRVNDMERGPEEAAEVVLIDDDPVIKQESNDNAESVFDKGDNMHDDEERMYVNIEDEDERLEVFRMFREALLQHFNVICNPTKVTLEVRDFRSERDNLEAHGLNFLEKYKNNADAYWVILDHLWCEKQFTGRIYDYLHTSHNAMVQRLMRFYMIRREIQKGDRPAAYRRFLDYFDVGTIGDMMTLTECLIWHEPEFAKFAFENGFEDIKKESSCRVLSMQYVAFAKFFGTKETIERSNVIAERHQTDVRDFFHPDVVLNDVLCRAYRDEYEKVEKKQFPLATMLRFSSTHRNDFCSMVEATRALYYHAHVPKAQEIKNRLLEMYTGVPRMRYLLAVINFETKFGQMNTAKLLNKIDNKFHQQPDFIVSRITNLIQNGKVPDAESILTKLLRSDKHLMNIHLQQGLFLYYDDWVRYLDTDLFNLNYAAYMLKHNN